MELNYFIKDSIYHCFKSLDLNKTINDNVKKYFTKYGYNSEQVDSYYETMEKFNMKYIIINEKDYPIKHYINKIHFKLATLNQEYVMLQNIITNIQQFAPKYNSNVKKHRPIILDKLERKLLLTKIAIGKLNKYGKKVSVESVISKTIKDFYNNLTRIVDSIYSNYLGLIFNKKVFIENKHHSTTTRFIFQELLKKRDKEQVEVDFYVNFFTKYYELPFYIVINNTKYSFLKTKHALYELAEKYEILSKEQLSNKEFEDFLSTMINVMFREDKNYSEFEMEKINKLLSLYEMTPSEIEHFRTSRENSTNNDKVTQAISGINLNTTAILNAMGIDYEELAFQTVVTGMYARKSTAIKKVWNKEYSLTFDFIESDTFVLV